MESWGDRMFGKLESVILVVNIGKEELDLYIVNSDLMVYESLDKRNAGLFKLITIVCGCRQFCYRLCLHSYQRANCEDWV